MNEILTSIFSSNQVLTIIRNPSPRVHCLMYGVSSNTETIENDDTALAYRHHDIGTRQDMEKLFEALDACK